MAVISIRLNTEEKKMIDFLSAHFEEDKSSLIKHSLVEMYEDLIDRNVIEQFEANEKNKKNIFVSADEVIHSFE